MLYLCYWFCIVTTHNYFLWFTIYFSICWFHFCLLAWFLLQPHHAVLEVRPLSPPWKTREHITAKHPSPALLGVLKGQSVPAWPAHEVALPVELNEPNAKRCFLLNVQVCLFRLQKTNINSLEHVGTSKTSDFECSQISKNYQCSRFTKCKSNIYIYIYI